MLDKIFTKIETMVPAKWRFIFNHEGFRRYFANTSWLFSGQIFSLLVSFLVGLWIARYLGPGNYGVLNYALSFAGLFSMVAGFGVDSVLARDFVRYPEKTAQFLGAGFTIKFVSGVFAWLLASAAAIIFIPEILPRVLVSLFSLAFVFQSFNIIDTLFRSRVEARHSARAQALAAGVAAIFKVAVIIFNGGVIWLIIAYVWEILLFGLILLINYSRRRFKIGPWSIKLSLVKKLLFYSWPLMLSGVSAFILLKIDQILIANWLSTEAVGIYAAATKLTEVWYFIPGIICSSFFPAIVSAQASNPEQFKKRLRGLYYLLLSLAILIALPLSLFAKPLVALLFGSAYIAAAPVAAIYIWSTLGWFISSAILSRFTIENRVSLIFLISFVPMVVNIILNILFIPIWGIIGSAWATLISYSLAILFIFFKSSKHESSPHYN